MDAKQKKQLRALIKTDCQLRYRYADGCGKFCVVGSILRSVGAPVKLLLAAKSSTLYTILGRKLTPYVHKALEVYGLTIDDLGGLQCANDAWEKPVTRRAAVLKTLDSIK